MRVQFVPCTPTLSSASNRTPSASTLSSDIHTDEISFVDVPVVPRDIGDRVFAYGWVPFLVQYLQDPAAKAVITHGADLRPLSSPLVIYFSTDEYRFKETVNVSLTHLTRGIKPVPTPWYGPIVVMKASAYPVTDFRDIELGDLVTVCAFFGRNK